MTTLPVIGCFLALPWLAMSLSDAACESMVMVKDNPTYSSIPQKNITTTPKQTLTPISFAPTPSETAIPSDSVISFFLSTGMIIFYVVFCILIVSLVSLFVYFRCFRKQSGETIEDTELNANLTEDINTQDEEVIQI